MKKLNIKKPTIVVIEALPNSGVEYGVYVVQAYLKELYGKKYQDIFCNNFLSVLNTGRKVEHENGVIQETIEEYSNPSEELGKRMGMLQSLIVDKKSFAFSMVKNNPNEQVHDILDSAKKTHNIIKIHQYTMNIFHALKSVSLRNVDKYLLFTYYKQAYEITENAHVISYEEMMKDPSSIIKLFDSRDDVNVKVKEETFEYTPVTLAAFNHIVSLLKAYKIKHYISKSNEPIYSNPTVKWFNINEDVPGWMDFNKLYYLSVLARFAKEGQTIVDINGFAGRSSCHFANNRKNNEVNVSFFNYMSSKNDGDKLEDIKEWGFSGKWRKTDRLGLKLFKKSIVDKENCNFVCNDLESGIRELEEGKVFCAFINVMDNYDTLNNYLEGLLPAMTKGGIIAVDGYNEDALPDIVKAVDDFSEEHDVSLHRGSDYHCHDVGILSIK